MLRTDHLQGTVGRWLLIAAHHQLIRVRRRAVIAAQIKDSGRRLTSRFSGRQWLQPKYAAHRAHFAPNIAPAEIHLPVKPSIVSVIVLHRLCSWLSSRSRVEVMPRQFPNGELKQNK